ncbi:MAG: HypC/HybG/HupF family hydrogenase formation chaperone [Gammaproteobacteria bacterium]
MCLAIPMQIRTIEGFLARCETKGVSREVNLFLMQDAGLVPGDFVMVHVGYAIQKLTEHAARSAWESHDAMRAQAGSLKEP